MKRFPFRASSFLTLLVSLCALLECDATDRGNYFQWHTVELPFEGPMTSESDRVNPFTDYALVVHFNHEKSDYTVRGFYAADGKAAESGADSGNIWKVRFTPDRLGKWTYEAKLRVGSQVALSDDINAGVIVPLASSSGNFEVVPTDKRGRDFRAQGRIIVSDGYLRFGQSGSYWIKGGAGSPENLLAYEGFDGTYRQVFEARKGEAAPSTELHVFEPHIQDWNTGDLTWRNGKGKGIVGGINYLSANGMNSIYFLTLNILGDGNDVWPYTSYEERSRFDCSKLDQWELLFQYMQMKGILLHMVTQETENEEMLDGGDTGPQRKLYYRELIARFGHHLALVWNLGEENGPAHWRPEGQNNEQQRSMASYLKGNDPYNHPVLIHTHATRGDKEDLLPGLLGHPPLDGLSFQIDRRETAHAEIVKWKKRSAERGNEWLITFDELGKWYQGVLPDAVDPHHDTVRHYALWGSLMAGAAGVEWYFGAHYEHNDLTAEDWRSRANVWEQTRYAMEFFETYIPYWEMYPQNELTARVDDYCFAKAGQVYAIYVPDSVTIDLNLDDSEKDFSVSWYDPIRGGSLQKGSVGQVSGPGYVELGEPPKLIDQDWVVLVESQ